MRHSPGFYRRFAWLALQTEVARGGFCLILLATLVVIGAPLWVALILPFLAYTGLWRLASIMSRRAADKRQRVTRRSVEDIYARCLSLQRKFQLLARNITDSEIADEIRQIATWIDRILQTIVEDDKYQATQTLINLIETTDDYLASYLKVIRRRLDGTVELERFRENLATLETAYERFYDRLNRDAVVDLEALSDTIEFNLPELGTLRQLGEVS